MSLVVHKWMLIEAPEQLKKNSYSTYELRLAKAIKQQPHRKGAK